MSILVPRYEMPVLDPATGRISREWYKFFQSLSAALGGFNTDDVTLQGALTGLDAQVAADAAQRSVKDALLLGSMPKARPPIDDSNAILAWLAPSS